MLDFKQILCPVDFSDPSRFALEHAIVIGGCYAATLTVLHVCDPLYRAEPPLLLAEFPARTGKLGDADRQELEARLEPWLASARAKRLPVNIVFDEGHNAAAPILRCAALLPADLIVMGTHGLGGPDRLLLGSVTEKVVRKAQSPVLTVPLCVQGCDAGVHARSGARLISSGIIHDGLAGRLFPRQGIGCAVDDHARARLAGG